MAAEYKVLTIDEMVMPGDTGVERFYRHRIKTKGGVTLTIDIAAENFTPEKAGPILLQAATNADKILALRG